MKVWLSKEHTLYCNYIVIKLTIEKKKNLIKKNTMKEFVRYLRDEHCIVIKLTIY